MRRLSIALGDSRCTVVVQGESDCLPGREVDDTQEAFGRNVKKAGTWRDTVVDSHPDHAF